jgi:hypothetical protein
VGSFSTQSPAIVAYTTTDTDIGSQPYVAFACDIYNVCSDSFFGSIKSTGTFRVTAPGDPSGNPVDCSGAGHDNVMTYTPNSNGTLNHFGTKAQGGIWVPAAPQNPVCGRASSILVETHGGSDNVEIGWFEDPQRTAPSCHYPLGDTRPRRLIAYARNGFFYCPDAGNPPVLSPSSGFEPMNVHLGNPSDCTPTNAQWQFWDDSQFVVAVVAVDFCQGVSTTNGERHPLRGSDNASSKFQGLQYFGGSGTWQSWDDNGYCYDTDSGYDAVIPSATYSEVQAGSNRIDNSTCY